MTYTKKLSYLVKTLKKLKYILNNGDAKYRHRAEYLIIKVQQLAIIDKRISKNMHRVESLRRKRKIPYASMERFQTFFSELILDTESFFYTASKFIDLLFEGLQKPLGWKREEKNKHPFCKRILSIRSNLIEHSHNNKQPAANEVCEYGYNLRYGPYLRSMKGADKNRPRRDRSYLPLRNGFMSEMLPLMKVSGGSQSNIYKVGSRS